MDRKEYKKLCLVNQFLYHLIFLNYEQDKEKIKEYIRKYREQHRKKVEE